MNEVDIHELAAAYALDAVDDRERAAFETHFPSCDVCSAEVGDFRETAARLAESANAPPPPSLRDRLLAQIAATRQLPPLRRDAAHELERRRRGRQRTALLLGSAAAAIVLLLAAFATGRRTTDRDEYSSAAAAILARPDTRITNLTGTGAGMFRVAWSPGERRAVVTADGLDPPGPGRAYELWLLDDSGPHPVRLLDVATSGQVRRVVEVQGTPAQWAVTIEAVTGAEVPTGEILFTAVN